MAVDLEQAKQALENGIAEAQELLKDPSKIDALLRQLEEKLKDIPVAGSVLADIPQMVAMIKGYITGKYTNVSVKVIATLVAAFVYVVKKQDLINDEIPVLGQVDDVALVAAAFHEQGMFALIGAAAILIAAVLTAVYIFTVVYPAFFMQFRPLPGEAQPCDPGLAMKLTLIFLSALLIAASLFAGRIMAYLSSLAGGVAG